MATYTISASSTVLINAGGENLGPDGLRLQFTVTGTNSAVLKVNTAPPGSAVSYTNVAYLNQSLVLQSAGTAVTSSGLVYIPLASCGNDLYVTNTWTSGSVVITTAPANIGGGSGPIGNLPAGDITAGTFGLNSGETGTYTFPGAATVTGAFTTATSTVSGTATATQLQSIAGTVTATSGAGRGTRVSTNLTAAANADALYGIDVAPTLTPGAFTGLTTAGVRIANNSTAVTGTKYGLLVGAQSGATTNVAILSQGQVLSDAPTGGIGYTTGAGGAQTQATNKSTGVTSNTITTAITMNNAALAAATIVSFTFTNSTIAATDTVICTHQSGGTSGAYTVNAFPGAGSAVISVRNNTAGSLSEAIVLRVTVIKSVSA